MVMKTENKEYDEKIGQVSQCVVVVVFLRRVAANMHRFNGHRQLSRFDAP